MTVSGCRKFLGMLITMPDPNSNKQRSQMCAELFLRDTIRIYGTSYVHNPKFSS